MGGPNLEVFKFGLYILFPIGWMYYFGTNLDNRFSVPDFWPRPEETHKIPFERDEIEAELARLRERRLARRARRLAAAKDGGVEGLEENDGENGEHANGPAKQIVGEQGSRGGNGGSGFGWLRLWRRNNGKEEEQR